MDKINEISKVRGAECRTSSSPDLHNIRLPNNKNSYGERTQSIHIS